MSEPTGGPAGAGGVLMESTRRLRAVGCGVLALLAYLPPLLQDRGRVSADTKQYLYLDPGQLMARATSLWDSHVALGTVTHQNIGYLFPAGPFYWCFDRLGVPDWVAQRLWLGSILFAAALGVLYLLRTLGTRGPGSPAAAVLYMCSPYVVHYSARLSILLVAWAALPWFIALAARALRSGGWRYPAAFAVVVQIAGSVNGSALIYVGLAPVLFILFAMVTREVSWRRALATTARIGVLTIGASLWWMSGLGVQSQYGLNVLRYSETIEVVATGGVGPEVFRGLGDWFLYGGDRIGPWVDAIVDYTQRLPILVVGYGLTIACLVSAAFVRWRYRAYFALLVFVGGVIATSLHPYDDPSPLGSVAIRFGEDTQLGLSLRNVGRAMPLIMLGLAVLGGAALNAIARRRPAGDAREGGPGSGDARAFAMAGAALVIVAAILVSPIVVSGGYFSDDVQRPEQVAGYWSEAIDALSADGTATRIGEIPGADFTVYRWGNSVEPITPGLTDRPSVARELIPYGSNASADLLTAYDTQVQLGLLDPAALAPLQRLMSVGSLVARNDLEWERYGLARPEAVTALIAAAPGIGVPRTFGEAVGPADLVLVDELEVARRPGAPAPKPVAVYPVDDPRPIVRGEATAWPIVVSGNGDGIVDLAALGLVDWAAPIRYAGSFGADRGALEDALAGGGVVVVTDTNRKRALRWDSIVRTRGSTEAVGDEPLRRDSADNRLDLFPDAGTDAFSVIERAGGRPTATAYGVPLIYEPYFRPAFAFDGDTGTAWTVGSSSPVLGERIRLDLDDPVRTDRVNLVQPLLGRNNRWITEARLRFTDARGRAVGEDVVVPLGDESRQEVGQTVTFPERKFTGLEIEVLADNVGERIQYSEFSGVGFSEIRIPDPRRGGAPVRVEEVVRMPTDLTSTRAAADLRNPVVYVMTRLRDAPLNGSPQEERRLARRFSVPAGRSFGAGIEGRVSGEAPDALVDRVLGIPGAEAGGLTARASSRLSVTPELRASAAVDGDPRTSWQSRFGNVVGEWVEIQTANPVSFDRLDLQVVADGRHSLPTQLRVEAGGESRTVPVPPITETEVDNATVTVPVTFAPLRGDRIRVTIDGIVPADVVPGSVDKVPVGIAELGIPGVRRAAAPATLAATCRDDLLALDGAPVSVRLRGTTADAARGEPFTIEPCDDGGVALAAGDHQLTSALGQDVGVDMDRVVLASAAGGRAIPGAAPLDRAALGVPAATPAPALRMSEKSSTKWTGTIPAAADAPFWLVLGESFNDGWRAKVDGADLGAPELVDGFANGWRVPAGTGKARTVELEWTPQRSVRWSLLASALVLLGCIGLMIRGRRSSPATQPDATFAPPWAARTDRPSGGAVAAVTVVAALLGLVVIGPVWALASAVLAFVALRLSRGRALLALAPAACLALAAAFVVAKQQRNKFPPIFEWPTFFDAVHWVAVAAMVLLLVDAIVEEVRDRAAR